MEKLWSRSFVQVTLAMFCLFTGFYILLPTLPLYVKEIGGNESQVGFVMGAFVLTAVACRPFVGGLMDRYGRRPFILLGLLLFVLTIYAYQWAAGIAVLLLLRVVHGISWASSTTAISTAAADIIPASRRGEGLGWFGLSTTLAMAVGPLFGLYLLEQHSYHRLFFVGACLAAAALLLSAVIKLNTPPRAAGGRIGFFEPSVLPVTSVCMLLAVAYAGITTYLPLFAADISVNAGVFFLVYACALTAIRPIAGRLSDRKGERFVIIPAIITAILALLVLSMSTGLLGVVISAVMYGIGFGAAAPALQAATLRIAPESRRGVANAAYATAFDLGLGIGAIALGTAANYIGYHLLFVIGACFAAAALAVYLLFVRDKAAGAQTDVHCDS